MHDRVGVAHQQYRGVQVLQAEFPHQLQHAAQVGAIGQGQRIAAAFARRLGAHLGGLAAQQRGEQGAERPGQRITGPGQRGQQFATVRRSPQQFAAMLRQRPLSDKVVVRFHWTRNALK